MQIFKINSKYVLLITCFISSFYSSFILSQCTGGNSINLSNYNHVEHVTTINKTNELSGLTHLNGEEFVLISDHITGDDLAQLIICDINNNEAFEKRGGRKKRGGPVKIKQHQQINNIDSDLTTADLMEIENLPPSVTGFESITYIDTPVDHSDSHRFAISDKNESRIVILEIDLSNPNMTIDYSNTSLISSKISIPGADSQNDDGKIESIAYDYESGRMYLCSESKQIYYYDLAPDNPIEITPFLLLDLNTIDNDNGVKVDINSLLGMDILSNGNLVLLTTYNQADPNKIPIGNLNRKLIEIDSCGSIISEFDFEGYFNSVNLQVELQDIASFGSDLYLLGANGHIYKLTEDPEIPILTITSPSVQTIPAESEFSIEWTILPSFTMGDLRIELYNENSKIHTFRNNAINNGTLNATLPNKAVPGTFYRIRITNTDDQTITAFSTYFEIIDCTSDCAAMFAFANSITDWNGRTPWDLKQDMGTWYGVTLHSDGSVKSINFDEDYIQGTIPPEIGDLKNIEILHLGDNNFSGAIPPQLGKLQTLTTLNLSGNDLTGDLPADLGNLSSVRQVYLSFNQLSGSIPKELGNLNELQYLDIKSNSLTGGIPAELGNLGQLLSLSLQNNQLTGSIPAELSNLGQLFSLFLDNNQLTGSIPSTLGDLSLLASLRTYNNQLSGCYDNNLLKLCGQLNAVNNTNFYISDGNNFSIPWEDFCANSSCP